MLSQIAFLPGSGEWMNQSRSAYCPRFASAPGRIARLLLLSASLLLAVQPALAELKPVAPRPLPTFRAERLAALLDEYAGRPLILCFWASWCESCREEFPALQRLVAQWPGSELRVVTIAVADDAQLAQAFLEQHAPRFPLVLDPDQRIAAAFGVYLIPLTLVLDRRHRVIGKASGAIDWGDTSTSRQLEKMLRRR